MHLRNVDRSSPHRPNIGVNTFYPVEEDRKAFFQRMCDAGSKRDQQHVVLRQQLLEKVQEEERGGKPVSTLTAAAEKQLIHRCVLTHILYIDSDGSTTLLKYIPLPYIRFDSIFTSDVF